MSTDKKHADFQSNYRRSSNFNDTEKDKDLTLDKNAELILESSDKQDIVKESNKEKIADAMDKMRERIEQTPGGEQSDNR